ncbi:hypothetical protein [Legionella pneumophila]|uniref:hypothetical protein n=1 Tax=Legionella pneumophila TaxID=446 RepID=UPI00331FFA58
MKDTPERLIAEAAAHSQSTHNVVTSNAAASLVIRLATRIVRGATSRTACGAGPTSQHCTAQDFISPRITETPFGGFVFRATSRTTESEG